MPEEIGRRLAEIAPGRKVERRPARPEAQINLAFARRLGVEPYRCAGRVMRGELARRAGRVAGGRGGEGPSQQRLDLAGRQPSGAQEAGRLARLDDGAFKTDLARPAVDDRRDARRR